MVNKEYSGCALDSVDYATGYLDAVAFSMFTDKVFFGINPAEKEGNLMNSVLKRESEIEAGDIVSLKWFYEHPLLKNSFATA